MSKINYQKIFNQLIDEHPHNIEAIKKIIKDAKENGITIRYTAQNIVDNYYADWSSDEICELFTALNIDPFIVKAKAYSKEYHQDVDEHLFVYLVDKNKREAFLGALKRLFALGDEYIKRNSIYKELIKRIYESSAKWETKVDYLSLLLDNTKEEILKEEIPTNYKSDLFYRRTYNASIFPDIIKSKNLDLVKKYAKYLKDKEDLTLYLPYATEKGNIDIVKYFLDEGADPNYSPDSEVDGYLSPLKIAIKLNDKAMYELLKSYGAKVDKASRLNEATYQLEEDYQKKMRIKNRDLRVLTSPLEYAIMLDEHPTQRADNCWYIVNFYTGSSKIYYDKVNEGVYNRSLMIDDMYEASDKSTIDYTQLLIATFATRNLDLFKKYANYILENKVIIDPSKVMAFFYEFKIGEGSVSDDIIDFFLDFLEKYQSKDGDLLLDMLKSHYDNRPYHFGYQTITVNSLLTKILDRLPESKRINIPIIVYVKTLEDVKTLESYGYNVNQLDEDGHNILYHITKEHDKYDGYNKGQRELLEYLFDHCNLSYIDRDGHNILYYMLKKFPTENEDDYGKSRRYENNIEDVTVQLIYKMDAKDVTRKDNVSIINGRISSYSSAFGDHIHAEYIYQHHEDLFNALLKKKCKFNDDFYKSIFASIYPKDNEPIDKEYLEKKINVLGTLRFIYEKLDKNTKVQCLNIKEAYQEINAYLGKKDATFEGFAKLFIDFNNHVVELKEFYQKNILKKYNPERYLEYAMDRYKTTYTGLDDMILSILTQVILKFPNEDIDTILSLCPNYDINHTVEGMSTDYSYWQYLSSLEELVETDDDGIYESVRSENRFNASLYNNALDGEDNIRLYGGLVQFAILINNLDMVKKLVARGANLDYSYDDEECSFQYVNSIEMEEYMESILGDSNLEGLDSDERRYYLSLLDTSENDS